MKKVLIIEACDKCPYYDNEYYSYSEECTLLDRVIDSQDGRMVKIPDDCPLTTATQEMLDTVNIPA